MKDLTVEVSIIVIENPVFYKAGFSGILIMDIGDMILDYDLFDD